MDPTTWQAPFLVVVGALFVIVMLRANATYWLGRAIVARTGRSRFSGVLTSRPYAVGASWLNRWGAPAVAVCFLTIGVQTMVNLAAGVGRMPLRRYLPAVVIGCIAWAFLYGTVGFVGFVAFANLWETNPGVAVVLASLLVVLLVVALTRKHRAPSLGKMLRVEQADEEAA